MLDGQIEDRRDLIARGKELGIDLENGGSVLAVRIHPLVPAEGDWQARALTIVGRGARGVVPGSLTALRAEHLAVIVPSADDALGRRAAQAVLRAVDDGMPGFAIVVGPQPHRGRPDGPPPRRNRGAAGGERRRPPQEPDSRLLSFEDTGAYRLLLPAMSDDPAELERFYTDTISPLVAYDEQYGTELMRTLETFLANDGSMAADLQGALHPPPHDPLPARPREGADRTRRQLHRRPRAPRARAEGDARAGRARAERAGVRARRGERPRPQTAEDLSP